MNTAKYIFLLGLAGALWACSTGAATRGVAPAWFQRPSHEAHALAFVGDATDAPDESSARQRAVERALHELTLFAGAIVRTDSKSFVAEKNGQLDQSVELSVEVAGEPMTVREVTIQEVVVQPAPAGFDAYARILWPKSQHAALLAARSAQAERAAALYEAGLTLRKDRLYADARAKLREAKRLVGPPEAAVPLAHPTLQNSRILGEAIDALGLEIDTEEKQNDDVCAVGVLCQEDGRETPCEAHRFGATQDSVKKAGRRLAPEPVPPELMRGILASESPDLSPSLRALGCLVLTELHLEALAEEQQVLYVRYRAKSLVYEPRSGRIVDVYELPPGKEGFPILDGQKKRAFDGAKKRSFDRAQDQVLRWLGGALAKVRS